MSKKYNARAEIRQTIAACKKADLAAEQNHMDLARLYWIVKTDIQKIDAELSRDFREETKRALSHHQVVLERLDRATSALSDVRQSYADVVYQLEQLVK